MRYARLLLLVVGMALLGVLVVENDPAAILAAVAGVSWGLGVLIVFPVALVMFFDTLGWRFAFSEDRVPFAMLAVTRLAGEAFNMVTPTGAVGGEAVKVWLLRGQATVAESASSVIIAKTTITAAQGLFLLVGVVIAWGVRRDSAVLVAMQWLLLVETLAVGAFMLAQQRGVMARAGALLGRIGLGGRVPGATLMHIDGALADFYRRRSLRLLLSTLFHLVAWLLGCLEAYLILSFMGLPVSLRTATVIEAFGASIKFATFLIPGSVGALEGGYAATFTALGLSSAAGLSFSLVRRMREAVWVGLGLLAFALMREPRRSADQEGGA
jgi:glycosyltransferase 2 family protein